MEECRTVALGSGAAACAADAALEIVSPPVAMNSRAHETQRGASAGFSARQKGQII